MSPPRNELDEAMHASNEAPAIVFPTAVRGCSSTYPRRGEGTKRALDFQEHAELSFSMKK